MTERATTERLWAAFMAGFGESGEGFNGEYVGERYRDEGALEASLRPYFDGWVQGKTSMQVFDEEWAKEHPDDPHRWVPS